MDDLRKAAKEILAEKKAGVVIGYGQGSSGRTRVLFITDPEKTDQLIYNDQCNLNLALYLSKAEVKKLGKIAIIATVPVMRAIMVLASEHQLGSDDLIVLGISEEGKYVPFNDFKAIENYLASLDLHPDEKDVTMMDRINAMSLEERWNFWQKEFSKCIKCYACRAACPLCYCNRCTVESNQPQWIPVESNEQGNLEWHIMRAMHIAGRCINCCSCAKACPMEIPLHLLTYALIGEIKSDFSFVAGLKADSEFPLSHINVDDKESFII